MANRYRVALARGREEYQRAIEEDAALLDEFGLALLTVQGCIRAAVKSELRETNKGTQVPPWSVVEINAKLWGWLRPILVELRDRQQTEQGRQVLLAAAK